MRLGDATGACADLRVAGYQFPTIEPGHHDWDANWLVIAGSVRTADGTSWSFHDPALTTWEAARVVTWLYRVADGAVPAIENRAGEAGWLTFTEPNLGFAVGAYESDQVQLLIKLSHESAEPPNNPQRPGRCHIAVTMSRQKIQDAAAELENELASHPAR